MNEQAVEAAWTGVAICQYKYPVRGLPAHSDGRASWPATWVDPESKGFHVSHPSKDEDLRAWAEMTLARIDELFERKDAQLRAPVLLTSHDGRFTSVIQKVAAPQGSIFSARTVRLFLVSIEANRNGIVTSRT